MRKLVLCALVAAGTHGCSFKAHVSATSKNLGVDSNVKGTDHIEQFIVPYRDSLALQMGEVIGMADTSFEVVFPSSNLMNWATDALLLQETQTVRLAEPVICILNSGGLRASLNKGPITVGDLFKLMPFDNSVAWVRLPVSRIEAIETFMKNQPKGVPLANARFEKGKLTIQGLNETHTHFWVITSDYLAQGGDKMTFFLAPEAYQLKPKNLRDVFIEEVKRQGTLVNNTEKRFIP
ncbi:MAG: 5'-nucleotidase C-terminal domain-containing protein [Flavobacteriales bacterium]|jgi:2',3'-cyclic-nucleotide 2'-phosphodiesterase (5'-nucleotidase family)